MVFGHRFFFHQLFDVCAGGDNTFDCVGCRCTLYFCNFHELSRIFTYVKNRHYEFGDKPHVVSGMLLYAKTEEEIQPDDEYQMYGSRVSVKTLDLDLLFADIIAQLNKIAIKHFGDGIYQG